MQIDATQDSYYDSELFSLAAIKVCDIIHHLAIILVITTIIVNDVAYIVSYYVAWTFYHEAA